MPLEYEPTAMGREGEQLQEGVDARFSAGFRHGAQRADHIQIFFAG
jgi:hypothetical protein